jgi:hypothetical protein
VPSLLYTSEFRSKAVPQHHGGAGGRGGITPTHSWPRHWMEWVVRVTPRSRFTPGEKTPGTHWTWGWVDPWSGLDTGARGFFFCVWQRSNLVRPVAQFVARHYTDWATPAPRILGEDSQNTWTNAGLCWGRPRFEEGCSATDDDGDSQKYNKENEIRNRGFADKPRQ